jgi:hypothetical protein
MVLERRYRMKIFGWVVAGLIIFVVFVGVSRVVGFGCGAVDNGVETAKKEFYPSALLKKYEWFKDASSQLAKKKADISVYESRFENLKKAYGDKLRSEWARSDLMQANLWESEVAGIIASYNGLAAEYNAGMGKFNWKFANAGEVPPGSEALPREFAPYISK